MIPRTKNNISNDGMRITYFCEEFLASSFDGQSVEMECSSPDPDRIEFTWYTITQNILVCGKFDRFSHTS